MDYRRQELLRRRAHQEALGAQKKVEDKLAKLKRATRTAKERLIPSTTKSETWHRMTLAWLDRDAGYTGEMSSARVWLRRQQVRSYIQLLAPFAQKMPHATNLDVEVAAVRANLNEWTAKGNVLLLEQARRDYVAERVSFAAWQLNNPGNEGWRKKPPTRGQQFLIARMALMLDLEPPVRVNRGSAHDWIAAHGGNPRLAGDVSVSAQSPTAQDEDAPCAAISEGDWS